MMSELVFYTNPQSRGRMVRWMLEEVGADYATEILAYGASMKSPEYLAINPMGKVPAIRHGETIVTECAAIIAYLADAFPDAGLAPPLEDRGAYYRWLFFAAGPLEAAIVNRSLGFEVPAEKEMMAGYGNFERTLDTLETALSGTPYVAGDAFTAADVYLGAHVAWGMQFGSIPARPAFESYARRVTERDACRRAAELDDAASE
jgi:glutathione S-transferase